MADQHLQRESAMASIRKEIVVNTSPELVWAALRDSTTTFEVVTVVTGGITVTVTTRTPHAVIVNTARRSADRRCACPLRAVRGALRDRTRFSVSDRLTIPLDDRRHLHRAAEQKHLAGARAHRPPGCRTPRRRSARLAHQRSRELQQSQRRAAGEARARTLGCRNTPSRVTNATFMLELSPT